MLFRKWHEQVQTSPIKRRDKEIKIHFKHYYYLKKRQYKTTDEQDARYNYSMFSNLDGDEHDDHPLQSETVFLAEMIPHQVCYFSAMLKLLVHNLENKHWVRRFSARVAFTLMFKDVLCFLKMHYENSSQTILTLKHLTKTSTCGQCFSYLDSSVNI